jgi:hypothetical protein
VKFLSFSQPWLWSIDSLTEPDAKRIENRGWAPPYSAIGERFAMHAAKSWDDAAISFFIRFGIDHPMRQDLYPAGVITSVATIDRVVTSSKTLPLEQRRWFFETRADGKQNYGWVLVNVQRLREPIPFKGAQGLRELPSAITAAIEAQL